LAFKKAFPRYVERKLDSRARALVPAEMKGQLLHIVYIRGREREREGEAVGDLYI